VSDSDTAAGRRVKILVAAEPAIAERLVAALDEVRGWSFDADVVAPAALAYGEDHDLYLVDAALLSPQITHGDPTGKRPLIAVTLDDADPQAALAAGAVDVLGRDELTPAVLERSIRHAVDSALANEALRELRARHELLLRATNDGVWEWDLRSQEVSFSTRWRQLVGLRDVELERNADSWFSRVHADDFSGLRLDINELIYGGNTIHHYEHRLLHADGEYRWYLSRGLVRRDHWGRAVSISGSLTDIHRRKRAEALNVRGQHDELTGLPSRQALLDRLEHVIAETRHDPAYRYSILFLNLDRFKILNDSIGLEPADLLLAMLGQRLRSAVDEDSLVCRYGGDEFAVLLEGITDFSEADLLAERIHEALRQPFEVEGQTIFTTASIGITNSDRNYDRPAEVIRDASTATTRAKRSGKSRSSTFVAAMRQEAMNALRTHSQLREAIGRKQFAVYYQPIVALGSYKLTGFEALVRWNHPNRGVIGPVEFIALAEETGLIVPIGQFVLREACSQMAAWHRRFPDANDISISINLSGHQLGSPNLVSDIEEVLTETGLRPDAVKLELTESTLIDDPTTATRILGRLRDRGIQLYIDDFGTGYSSLSYLHRFSIDGLKIDKSFVDMVGMQDRKAAIVPSIVGLAHNLGIGVVAEGVETVAQAHELTLIDCAEAQGYLFSRPVPRDQAAELILRRILG
jgi:diguanylate cyclase (GGDEF)-like protein/PAS domain S-box-containing protein